MYRTRIYRIIIHIKLSEYFLENPMQKSAVLLAKLELFSGTIDTSNLMLHYANGTSNGNMQLQEICS